MSATQFFLDLYYLLFALTSSLCFYLLLMLNGHFFKLDYRLAVRFVDNHVVLKPA